MANIFDQFDVAPVAQTPTAAVPAVPTAAAAAPPAAEKNPFDQFDDPRFSGGGAAGEKFLEGIPIVGAAIPAAGAAISALAHPLTGVGADGETIGERYSKNLEQEKASSKAVDEQHPVASEVLKVGGGVAATLPVAATAQGARLLGLTGSTLARRAAAGAASGAVIGGADAAARGEDVAKGALTSGILGAAAPVAGHAIGRTVEGVRNAVSPEANVAADLGRAIQRDNMTPADLLQRAQDLSAVRPGVATLADAGGENVRGLVERVAQTPGAGRTTVVPALTDRQQTQALRLGQDLRQLTGTQRTAVQAINDTMAERAQTARPLYDDAFNFNARQVPEIDRAWREVTDTGFGQQILRSGDFRRALQTEYGIRDPNQAPLMVLVDAWKKQADGLIGEAIRAGNNNRARILGDMRDRLIGVVDQHNPAYGRARAAWAGPSQYLDTIEQGRGIFNTGTSAEELANTLRGMSHADQEAYRTGAVSAIVGKMGNDSARLGDMTKYLRSPEMRAKIAALMPTPQAQQAWEHRLNFEVGSSELTGRSLGNSATARRLAEKQDADSIVGDLIQDAFMGHPPVSLLRRALTAVPQRVRDTLRSRSDAGLADLLTNPNAMARLPNAVARIQNVGNISRGTETAAAALSRAAIPAFGSLGGPGGPSGAQYR